MAQWKTERWLTPHRNSGSHRAQYPREKQALITAVFEAAERAANSLTHLVPDLDRDRTEYAVASVLLEEACVSSR